MAQSNRILELDAVAQESRPGGRGFLTKAAGTGQEDAQCCEVDGVMPAPTTDDLGIYVLASILGRTFNVGFVEHHYFRVLLAAWVFGVVSLSLFLVLRQGLRALLVFPVVASLAYIYSYAVDGGLLFVNYGRRWSGAGDLFYGLQSTLAFAILGPLLISGHVTRVAKSNLVRIGAYSFGLFLIATTEVIRSGSILWMTPILLWASNAARKKYPLPRFVLLAFVAWVTSKAILLSFGALRWLQTGIKIDLSTLSHPSWHTLYLGLSYTLDGTMNQFGVRWDDNWLYQEVSKVIPSVRLYSAEYNLQVRTWFIEALIEHPMLALQVLGWKLTDAAKLFWQEIAIGVVLMMVRVVLARKPINDSQLVFAALSGSTVPLLIAIPIPQYLGFALPLSHVLIVAALFSLIPRSRSTLLQRSANGLNSS